MIAYIDIEHISMQANKERWSARLARLLNVKYKLEEVSGEPCLIIRYEKVTPKFLDELGIKAICVSGSSTELPNYSPEEMAGMRQIFETVTRPTIGFCGGHQMMSEMFGVDVKPINEEETGTMVGGGWRNRTHELGMTPVHVTQDHPLFAGLGHEMKMFQAHYWEVKSLPAGFKAYASSDITPIQFMAHESKPLFGTQFHPEEWDDEHTDGRVLLENFFNLISSKT